MSYKAIVRFLNKNEGGRTNPPMSGYRPQLKVGEEYTSCIIKLVDVEKETMDFGIEHTVSLELIYFEQYKDCITKEMKVELFEGNRLVGIGHLTE